jgi:hypothetical protein
MGGTMTEDIQGKLSFFRSRFSFSLMLTHRCGLQQAASTALRYKKYPLNLASFEN